MKRLLLLACLTILLTALGFWRSSHAEKRVFILGINTYDRLPPLSTAVNDSVAVADALRSSGFSVVRLNDATSTQFAEKWREFLAALKPGDTAAFYFAGHGLQVDGANYLVLRDTPGPEADDSAVLSGSLNFHELMEQLEARELSRTIYILDACRVSPFSSKPAQMLKGQTRGLAPIESVFGAFVMYSAGAGEEALDFLVDPVRERNSVYARRLLALLRNKDLSISDIATQVRVQVESDANSVKHKQRPAYFDGITGRYYLAAPTSDGKRLSTSARIAGDNVIRLGGFATWDSNCQSRPAPRVTTNSAPRYGRIITRFETFTIAGVHAGEVSCNQTTQKGVGVYYVVDEASRSSTAVDSIQLTVRHWSVAPSFSATERFDVDLATKFSRRVTGR